MSEKTAKWCILPALFALGVSASAEATTDDLRARPCPAFAAAPLTYSYVPAPLGSRTWADRQLADLRAGPGTEIREELGAQASYILLALDERSTPQAHGPRAAPAPDAAPVLEEPELQSAFDALGLTPADLLGPPDISPEVLTIAGAVLRFLDWGFDGGTALRDRVRGSRVVQIDPDDPVPGGGQERTRHRGSDEPVAPAFRIVKGIVRSAYKMLLGIAIGVLFWGVVRRA